MSAHEMLVEWPCFFEAKARLEKLTGDLEGSVSAEEFASERQRTMGGGG